MSAERIQGDYERLSFYHERSSVLTLSLFQKSTILNSQHVHDENIFFHFFLSLQNFTRGVHLIHLMWTGHHLNVEGQFSILAGTCYSVVAHPPSILLDPPCHHSGLSQTLPDLVRSTCFWSICSDNKNKNTCSSNCLSCYLYL